MFAQNISLSECGGKSFWARVHCTQVSMKAMIGYVICRGEQKEPFMEESFSSASNYIHKSHDRLFAMYKSVNDINLMSNFYTH